MRLLLLFAGFSMVATAATGQVPVHQANTLPTKAPAANALGLRKEKSKAADEVQPKEIAVFAPEGVDIELLPLYGNYAKTPAQLAFDEQLVQDCLTSFGTRAEASKFFSNMGWDYLSEGNRAEATRRFNRAFLLNESAADAFWGLGVIAFQSDDYETAIKLINRGLVVSPNNPVLMSDLATVYLKAFSVDVADEKLWLKGMDLLAEAIKLQPNFVGAYMQQSLGYMLKEDFPQAWKAFHAGYDISPAEINVELLMQLKARQPDPKQIFN